MKGAIRGDVALRHAMLLVAHTWSRRWTHRAWGSDYASQTRQALTTRLRRRCDMHWGEHLGMSMGNLTEGEWCAWADGSASRDSSIAWRHDTVDGRLVAVAVEAAAFDVWAERTEIISLFVVVVRRHGLVSHSTGCWRLQTQVAKERKSPADGCRCRAWCAGRKAGSRWAGDVRSVSVRRRWRKDCSAATLVALGFVTC